jgi:hypothetical protein
MKKLMALALGMAFALTTVAVTFAQDDSTKGGTTVKKESTSKKKGKKGTTVKKETTVKKDTTL